MDEQIKSIAAIERRARSAAESNGWDVCPFPDDSAATKAWRIAHQVRVDELALEVAP